MKTIRLAVLALAFTVMGMVSARSQNDASTDKASTSSRPPANYIIRVEWKEAKGAAHHLEVLTAEGKVNLETFLPEKVKINNAELPITVRLTTTLKTVGSEKGRVDLFLGRTFPYVTGTSSSNGQTNSTYEQRMVGLTSTFVVTFGKALVIQSDENEEVSILVKRAEPKD